MAEADYFIGIMCPGIGPFAQLDVEHNIAFKFGIPSYTLYLKDVVPDAKEIERKYYEEYTRG